MKSKFELKSEYSPSGSQPAAIKTISQKFLENNHFITLLGVTGSGKTFTMAQLINNLQKPALVIAHNKTLATQLYHEFKGYFPANRVEFFVSYYDYYQPESYLPQKDQYIEKDAQINEKIEQMRLSATASLVSRDDVIVVASVSCIFSAGNPEFYSSMGFEIRIGENTKREDIIRNLINIQYERNDIILKPGFFRVRGDAIDLIPSYKKNIIRIEMFGNTIERIIELDKITQDQVEELKYFNIYPAKHFVIPEYKISAAINSIKTELEEHLPSLDLLEAQQLKKRTLYDLEMIEETGFCKGIENYSRHFDNRKQGEKPFCLLDYFKKDFLIIIDESHQTIPQLHGMYRGDYSRKKNLVDYGFRLPSAFDNRPLKFHEFEEYMNINQVLFVSATPGNYEKQINSPVVEQIIRPTGLVDPVVLVRPIKGQVSNLITEIKATIKLKNRALVTTLTKKMAEELSEYLANEGLRTRYLHSEIDTIERSEIIRELRLGVFDVLVGINLLREGLDLPEVGFIGIFDADKEGFLRDARSLIQIIGRAARNIHAKVILYGDNITGSMSNAIKETARRRKLQQDYNQQNRITPKTIIKPVPEKKVEVKETRHIPKKEAPKIIRQLEKEMNIAADQLDFEYAILLREKIKKLKERIAPENL